MKRLLFIVLAACSHGTDPAPVDPAVPAADPAPCADVAANTAKIMTKKSDQLQVVIAKHCVDDKWSVALRKCGLLAKTEDELEPCHKEFVGTQFESLKKDLDAQDSTTIQDTPPNPMQK